MSQEERNPNTTPKANHNTDLPQNAPPPRLSPPQTQQDPTLFPRRSSSLQPSPGALNDMQHDGGDAAGGGEEQSGENVSLNGEEGTGEVSLNGYEKGLHEGGMQNDMINAKERLEGFDWEGLEERFGERMEECRRVEEGVKGEFEELVQVFNAWATAGVEGEEERAGKRLRTRMAFVQQREESLEEKRSHYIKVVKAFESALALLSTA